jgi:hypothetical protein
MPTKKPISDQLRDAILRCGKTRYRICQETGLNEGVLSRFINTNAGLSMESVDKLCECIGARLVLDAEGSKVKPPKRKAAKAKTTKRQGR